jgi:hypothetical protein
MRLQSSFFALLAAGVASAQTPPRQLSLVQDGRIELSKAGGAREALVVPGSNGRVAVAPRNGWDGAISVFDSAGVAMPWKIQTGRNDNAEIMFVTRAGWIAGTNTLWVSDRGYSQVALIDGAGKVTKSIEYASWVHPSWAQRRQFPVFGSMEPIAVYADQTMLVLPGRERSLISTPGYDHSVTHLLRTTWSGAIQKTIATFPLEEGRIDLRGRNGTGHVMNIPFSAKQMWSVSPDGMHIAIVIPGVSAADSGTFRVVSLNDRGDTVFTKRYGYPAVRVDRAQVDRFLANIQAVGEISAERLRDSAAKQIPAFASLLNGVVAGSDGSTWVVYHAPNEASKEVRAMVIDARGELVGGTVLPENSRVAAAMLDHLWTFEIGRTNTPIGILRFAARATGVPPTRTAKPSASPSPSPTRR